MLAGYSSPAWWRHGWRGTGLVGVERDDVLEHRLTKREHGEIEKLKMNSPRAQ